MRRWWSSCFGRLICVVDWLVLELIGNIVNVNDEDDKTKTDSITFLLIGKELILPAFKEFNNFAYEEIMVIMITGWHVFFVQIF